MTEFQTIIKSISVATTIVIYFTSCMGLGYFSGFLVLRRKWPRGISIVMLVAIAFLWPAIIVGYVMLDINRYHIQHPNTDGGGIIFLILLVGFPFLALVCFALAFTGLVIAYRKEEKKEKQSTAQQSDIHIDRS